ncbi:MAG: type II CRISPR-associated endonuclease Cas1 [Corynebacterium sp.]|nr:type II CRISPR-associated endonuclease Cas1 [Corynebacterium sp.]
MNAGWRVIDCMALTGELRYSRGQLVVKDSSTGVDTAIPLAQIAVVLVGNATMVSGAVVAKLSEYDIALLICDWRQVPIAGALPWREHTRIGARQRSQAALSAPRRKQAWSRVITSKIRGQAYTLELLGLPGSKELLALSQEVRSGDPTNVEAQAAKRYWGFISGEQSFFRIPGGHIDGWNSGLDYGYTLLRGYGIRAATSAGLCGALGIFHHGRSNAFALVDDLMEPFRPMVDFVVFSSFTQEDSLSREMKSHISESLTNAFGRDGKSMPTVFNEFAQDFGLYVEGQRKSLSVPIWQAEWNA